MQTPWIDAHCHLQSPRLTLELPEILKDLESLGIQSAVVNGTTTTDWQTVSDLAQRHAWIQPAYGLHPWFLAGRPTDWLEQLEARLDYGGSVGEIGLDRWKPDLDFSDQTEVFRKQLILAARRELPVTIHCLKAWGPMLEILEEIPLPGFLLHSYSGSPEMVSSFARLGAYFSFSGYFLNDKKQSVQETFKSIPRNRLLVETDAPDMLLPAAHRTHQLIDETANHPANITAVYSGLASILETPVDELAGQVADNFTRLFPIT